MLLRFPISTNCKSPWISQLVVSSTFYKGFSGLKFQKKKKKEKKKNTFLIPNSVKLTIKKSSWEVWWCAWARMALFETRTKGLLRFFFFFFCLNFSFLFHLRNLAGTCLYYWVLVGFNSFFFEYVIVWKKESYTLEIIWEDKGNILNLQFTIIFLFCSSQIE